MRIARIINLVVLILLSLASGVAKVLRVPNEVAFFEEAGLSAGMLVALGIAQLIGGSLLLFPRTRKAAALIVAVTFVASTLAIFVTGKIPFGIFSLLPVLMCGFLVFERRAPDADTDAE